MSSDVKKHLFPRHRTEIHLYRPEKQGEVAGSAEVGSAGAETEISDPTRVSLKPADAIGQKTAPAELASSPVPVAFLAQPKSVKP